jgi:hypothetical protein
MNWKASFEGRGADAHHPEKPVDWFGVRFWYSVEFPDILSHLAFLLEDWFPINLLRSMTIAIPDIKKRTGANKVV